MTESCSPNGLGREKFLKAAIVGFGVVLYPTLCKLTYNYFSNPENNENPRSQTPIPTEEGQIKVNGTIPNSNKEPESLSKKIPEGYEPFKSLPGIEILQNRYIENYSIYAVLIDPVKASIYLSAEPKEDDQFIRKPIQEHLNGRTGIAVNGMPYYDVNDFQGGSTKLAYPIVRNGTRLNNGFMSITENPTQGERERSPQQLSMLVITTDGININPYNHEIIQNPKNYPAYKNADIMVLEKPDAPGRNNRSNVNRTHVGMLPDGKLVILVCERMKFQDAANETKKWTDNWGRCGGGNDTQLTTNNEAISFVEEKDGVRRLPQALIAISRQA